MIYSRWGEEEILNLLTVVYYYKITKALAVFANFKTLSVAPIISVQACGGCNREPQRGFHPSLKTTNSLWTEAFHWDYREIAPICDTGCSQLTCKFAQDLEIFPLYEYRSPGLGELGQD